MNTEQAIALRKPFPPESVGRLPKGGVMLDYVGHAAVTDRLLTIDPEWSWEPFALDDHGLPALDRAGNLWIRLTICGVTRIGVGDGKSAKEVIGDAIRNAAMRFGVALDLWAKEDLREFADAARARGTTASGAVETANDAPTASPPAPESDLITAAQQRLMRKLLADYGLGGKDQRDDVLALVADVIGHPVTSSSELTRAQATRVVDFLRLALGETPQEEQ